LIFESNVELILETITPVRVLSKLGHGSVVATGKELLGDIQALQLVHGFDLLLTLGTGIVKSLVLLLDQ